MGDSQGGWLDDRLPGVRDNERSSLILTLSYRGTFYTFAESAACVKGRLACDCGKSRLIRQSSDPEFPLLHCGDEISVVSVADALPTGASRQPGLEP
ncbi:MAG TPA: hypothetical protein VEV17_17150 [Bryobacteraceae bacterium]|nr:hypothetical protein [Bryobacteraceae bacterium]